MWDAVKGIVSHETLQDIGRVLHRWRKYSCSFLLLRVIFRME
jgi:hypothetical protein